MAETRLALLGPLHLSVRERPLLLASPPFAALLGCIALNAAHGCAISRERLASMLWPDRPEIRARRSLTDTLYRLRRMLGNTEWLWYDERAIALRHVWIDVDEFRTYTASPDLACWRAALELYKGDLLEELDAEWLLGPRATLRTLYLVTLARVCTTLEASGAFSDALVYAQQWTLADPLNEDAQCTTIRLHARLGNHIAALQQYDHLVGLLDEELQTAPLPKTRALANAIRAEYHAAPAFGPPLLLVGRRQERAALLTCAEQAQEGHGGIALVEGERGIGKTRLLETLAEGAAWRGLTVVWGTARQSAARLPYAPLQEALQAALAGPRFDQVRACLPVATMDILTRLVPGLARTRNDQETLALEYGASRPSPAQRPPNRGDPPPAPAALADVLNALADIAPHAIIFDNMQWADARFWEIIRACAPRLARRRLLIILSYRGYELRADPVAWPVLRALDRDFGPSRVLLRGLEPDECADLARALGSGLDRDGALDLHRRTGGNPLLVREMLARQEHNRETTASPSLLNHAARTTPYAAAPEHCDLALNLPVRLPPSEAVEAEVAPDFTFSLPAKVLGMDAQILSGDLDSVGRLLEELRCLSSTTAGEPLTRGLAVIGCLSLAQSRLKEAAIALKQAISACDSCQPHPLPGRVIVSLARADAPLGKTLADAERVAVRWTVDAGDADAAILRSEGKVALRRYRITRLLTEAHAQGAAPTDRDLARALDVTERTVETDMAALRATGRAVATRRRRAR